MAVPGPLKDVTKPAPLAFPLPRANSSAASISVLDVLAGADSLLDWLAVAFMKLGKLGLRPFSMLGASRPFMALNTFTWLPVAGKELQAMCQKLCQCPNDRIGYLKCQGGLQPARVFDVAKVFAAHRVCSRGCQTVSAKGRIIRFVYLTICISNPFTADHAA